MSYAYHPGELKVQERAGVLETAQRLARAVQAEVPAAAKDFLEERSFVVLATADARNRPWASVLTGPAGFARAIGDRTVRIDARPAPGDPLALNLESSVFAGLIAPDLATRRRLRINGRLEAGTGGAILIHVEQAYSNCPKYIQRRQAAPASSIPSRLIAHHSSSLMKRQQDWIRRADTFFIATLNPGEGADASHRGGFPGFITVDEQELVWPDYAGNSMFNTLGNIVEHPRAGILVPDFETASALQLTGRVRIEWGAERLVRFTVEKAIEIENVLPPVSNPVEYSPFNPR